MHLLLLFTLGPGLLKPDGYGKRRNRESWTDALQLRDLSNDFRVESVHSGVTSG